MEGIQHRIVIVVVKHRKKTETSAANAEHRAKRQIQIYRNPSRKS